MNMLIPPRMADALRRPVALLAETFGKKVGGRCRDNRIDSAVKCCSPVPVVCREAKACQAKDRRQHVRGCDGQVVVDCFHCAALHWRCDDSHMAHWLRYVNGKKHKQAKKFTAP